MIPLFRTPIEIYHFVKMLFLFRLIQIFYFQTGMKWIKKINLNPAGSSSNIR
jgi:hypothetical protein